MIDTDTVILCTIVVEVFLAIPLAAYWKMQSTYPGFSVSFLSLLTMAVGQTASLFLDGVLPERGVMIINGFCILLAVLFLLDGLTRFFRKSPLRREIYVAGIPALVAAALLIAMTQNLLLLNILFSGTFVLIVSQSIAVLLAAQEQRTLSRLLASIYALLILLIVLRLVSGVFDPTAFTLVNDTPLQRIGRLFVLVTTFTATFLFLLLHFQRMSTELTCAKRAAEDLADRYALAISSGDAGIWDMDIRTGALARDASLDRLVGAGAGTDASMQDIRHHLEGNEEFRRLQETVGRYERDGGDLTTEFPIRRDDGSLQHLRAHVRVIPGKEREDARAIGLLYDITPLRKAEAALKTAHEKLNLLTGITRHDILNQAMVVTAYGEMLLERPRNAEEERMIRAVVESGERITHLIRFTGQYQNLGLQEPDWIDPVAVMSDASLRSLLGKQTLHLPAPGTRIYADGMFEKVLYNLVDNSCRHGGKVTTVTLSYRFDAGSLIIVYEDDGVGVPDSDKEAIFRRGVGKNSGLGLFLSREILAITGLSIRETGTHGKGARFEIHVPPGLFRIPGDECPGS
ncbi:sensor histidine kinase [Methanoculleus taiwanensis]|uniref:sensor histidine kinase n=1 Tax=Methanoculleus taiwanensis TaxID=1550565 RepID=UPI000FFED206|nr:HAMP domain-containing sensor histidine kinase [Methanoculleus taiwanensis]